LHSDPTSCILILVNADIKALAPKMPTKFLRDFFAEKDIAEKTFEVEGASGTNHIPNTVVVEHITKVGRVEADKLANVFRKIDFANGDVNHFLAHLAQALAV